MVGKYLGRWVKRVSNWKGLGIEEKDLRRQSERVWLVGKSLSRFVGRIRVGNLNVLGFEDKVGGKDVGR